MSVDNLSKNLDREASFRLDVKFWNDIETWTDPTKPSAVLHDTTSLHEKIYEECKKFDRWTHPLDKYFPEELTYNLSTMSGSLLDRGGVMRKRWKVVRDESWDYYHTVPYKEDFPTIYKFLEQNTQYDRPVLSKLGPDETILMHDHGPWVDQYLYNMSINEPVGAKMAIYPTGIVPYKPGDIWKLYVHNKHSVHNGGNEYRYHMQIADSSMEIGSSKIGVLGPGWIPGLESTL